MSEPHTPQPSRPPRPDESILDVVERLTGEVPKVLLREEGSSGGATPFVTVRSETGELVPQGRGNYQVLGEIARGGMGVVLKGHDRDLGRDVAIKLLDEKLSRQPGVVQRFVEEAQIGGQLQHPGVVPVYELGLMGDQRPFFAMKLVKGRTLQSLLSRRKSLDEDRRRFLSIFESVCQTLAYAHSKGVVHRDLKPANVMVGAFGEVQVVDWGLAKVLRQGGVADERRARREAMTVIETVRSGPGSSGSDSIAGSVMGTPAYMPPEQARGDVESVDERSDVFALGAILCELLTGAPPYVEREGAERLIVQAAQAQLGPARERLEACQADPELVNIALACLAPAPQARPQSAGELAERVHAFLSATEERAQKAQVEAAEARVKVSEERKARRLTLALAATVIAALVAAGAATAWFGRLERQRAAELQARVDEARAQVTALQAADRLEQAVEAARAALGLLENEESDGKQREQLAGLLSTAQARLAARDAELARRRENRALLDRLAELRARQSASTADFEGLTREQLDEEFAAVFRAAGLDLDAPDLLPLLDEIRSRGLSAEMALALDDLARLRRAVYGWQSPQAEALTALAADLDPDPDRSAMREALFEKNEAALLAQAAALETDKLPASTQWVLAKSLIDLEHQGEALDLLERAVLSHPGDARLRVAAAEAATQAEQPGVALGHLEAALALRPDDSTLWVLAADARYNLGDLVGARSWYVKALALRPRLSGGWNLLAYCQLSLDDFAGAERSWMKASKLDPSDRYSAALLVSRFLQGHLQRAEFLQEIEPLRNTSRIDQFIAWTLVVHPDKQQRDPRLAAEILEPIARRADASDWPTWHTLARAQEELDRPAEALASLRRMYVREATLRRDIQVQAELLEARLQHSLGDEAAARAALGRAEQTFSLLGGTRPQPWAGTQLARELAATSAQLGS